MILITFMYCFKWHFLCRQRVRSVRTSRTCILFMTTYLSFLYLGFRGRKSIISEPYKPPTWLHTTLCMICYIIVFLTYYSYPLHSQTTLLFLNPTTPIHATFSSTTMFRGSWTHWFQSHRDHAHQLSATYLILYLPCLHVRWNHT